ncbi:MAG: TRAP transporter small permease [Casimicrobiaceae bacterium]
MKREFLAVARGVEVAVDLLSRVAVVAMTLLVLVQVVLRYVLKVPLVWVEEATVFLMIWMAFMGAAIGVRRGAHIAMTILVDRLPARVAGAFYHVGTVAVIAFAGVVVWEGVQLVLSVGGQRSAALGLPMTIPYLIVPLGALLIILQAIANTIDPPRPVSVDVD